MQPLGPIGEELAYHFLKKNRYKILFRNYTCPLGEIDIIAKHKKTLVFVEVKTRHYLGTGTPLEAVDTRKQRQLVRVAVHFLNKYHLFDRLCRFDVIAITFEIQKKPKIELIQDAIWMGG